jgi:RimJ/RimL family protein N-acetyltransferase
MRSTALMAPGTAAAPVIETPRLRLRGWRPQDLAPYAAMLADPETARFITRRGRPYCERESWNEVAWFIGHWQLLGFGMFVVEARVGDFFLGRVGALHPPGWPAVEIGWALTPAARGQGIAIEAARAVLDWTFERFDLARIVSLIDPRNAPSQSVALRLGERRTAERFAPFGEPCDIWELRREEWAALTAPAARS